jgi:hypothetical protein
MVKNKVQMNVTSDELKVLREVDVRTVDRSTLVDAENVKINAELPLEERIAEYVGQIKNPYCYLYKGMVVKISFSGKRKLEDCLKDSLFADN